MATKGDRIDDVQLARIVRSEIEQSDGGTQDGLNNVRTAAIAYYYGKERTGDQVLRKVGRSTARTTDLADMVEAVVAQMAPSMSDAGVAKFDPIDQGDEDQAEIESQMVAEQVYQANDGFVTLQQAVKDALLMRSAFVKVWVDSETTEYNQTVKGVNEATAVAIMTNRQPNETIEVTSQEESGETPEGETLYDLGLRHTITTKALKIEPRRCEDMAYQSGWQKPTLEGCRFIAERAELERAELLDMGVAAAEVERLQPYTIETTRTSTARSTTAIRQLGGHEWSTELIETWLVYLRIDLRSSGNPQLYRIIYSNDRVLKKDEVPFVPYVNGTALLRPYRLDGISLYDKLAPVEDAKTHALRQWSDNLTNRNNARAGLVEGQVNYGDWARRTPGGGVRIKSPDAIVPLTSEDLGPSAMAYMDYQDKQRSERGGASLDLQSAEAQVAGQTAHGTERQYSARELLASLMARNVAETLIRGLWRLVHRTMRTGGMGEIQLKRAGEWSQQDPREWKERSRLSINVGLTVSERERTRSAYREIIGQQTAALQAGMRGQLADLDNLHAAALELAKASGVPAPERFYVDPNSPQARQTAQAQAEAEREASQLAQQVKTALLQMTFQHEQQMKRSEQQLEAWKHTSETTLSYFEALIKRNTELEVTEAQLVADAAQEIAKANGAGDAQGG